MATYKKQSAQEMARRNNIKKALQLIVIACSLISSAAIAKLPRYADTVIINANIYSKADMDAIAVTDGMISYVGTFKDIKPRISGETELIDLNGRSLYPGFIDLNNYVFEEALVVEGSCMLPSTEDLATLEKALRVCIAAGMTQPQRPWIVGFARSLPGLNDSEFIPRVWLDQLFPDRPVTLVELTSDMMWANTVALDRVQYHSYSLNPPGGKIIKSADGAQLTGVLLGSAGEAIVNLARKKHPELCGVNYQRVLNKLMTVAKEGITTLGDGRSFWLRGWTQMWENVLVNGDLSVRVTVRPWLYPHLSMKEQLNYFSTIARHDLTSKLIVNQVKLNVDGSYAAGTAKISEFYPDSTLASEPSGMFYITPSEMNTWFERLDKIGFGVQVNATGDEAVKAALNSIQNIRGLDVDQMYSITHHGAVNTADISRFAALNVSADFQVSNDSLVSKVLQIDERLSSDKLTAERGALRSLHLAGANITLSSGWGSPRFAPLKGIAKSLLMDNKGLPDIDAAIAAYTINPARALGLEGITGSIDVGKSADFVILEKDITQLAPEQISTVEVVMTMVEGGVVYRSIANEAGA